MAESEPKAIEVKEGEEVDIETLTKELETHNNNNSNNRNTYFVRMNIMNRTQKPLFLAEIHFWHGGTRIQPLSLPVSGGIDHPIFGSPPQGVKYAVLYADGDDSLSRQFLAAAHVPLPAHAVDPNTFKVYVEAGPRGPIDWNVVEVKLDMATSNRAIYDDPIFGGQVEAEVRQNRTGYTYINFRN